jgi:hypothetical protein
VFVGSYVKVTVCALLVMAPGFAMLMLVSSEPE